MSASRPLTALATARRQAAPFVCCLPGQPSQKIENLKAGQVGICPQFTRQVPDLRSGRQAIQPAVVTENEDLSTSGPQKVQKETDGRGFPCAIQPKKTENLAPKHVEVEFTECREGTVPFREATN